MCRSSSTGSTVAVTDAGKTFALSNPSKSVVDVTKVDGCAITIGIRCDYLYCLESTREIFVELKGADIKKAVRQIAATVPQLSSVKKELRAGVVVASRVPRADTATQVAMADVRRNHLSKLVVRSGPRLELGEMQLFA